MASKLVDRVTESSSKADEYQLFQQFTTRVGEGSYLSSLFSREMVTWVVSQIEQDSFLDLYGAYQGAIRAVNTESDSRRAEGRRYQESLAAMSDEQERLQGQIADLTAQRDRANELLNLAIDDGNEQAAAQGDRANAAERKIECVKARIASAFLDGRLIDPVEIRDLLK